MGEPDRTAMVLMRMLRLLLLAGLVLASTGPFRPGLAAGLQPADGGTLRAVVIGIDKYEHVANLNGAVADATDIASALKHAGAAEVFLLTDANARRRSVVAAMDHLVRTARAGDLVVVAFSGHGARVAELPQWRGLEPGGTNEEFVLAGYDRDGPETAEVIMNKEMKAWLARLDAKRADVLFIADSCFGGGMTRKVDPRAGKFTYRTLRDAGVAAERNRLQPIPMSRRELLVSVGDLPHVTFLAGGDSEHLVPEVTVPGQSTPRGALSYAVARALEGAAADPKSGVITRLSLLAYVLQIVQQYSDGNQLIDTQPKTEDEAVLARVLFRPKGGAAVPPPPPETSDRIATLPSVPLAIINAAGPPEPAAKGIATAITTDRDQAVLVWDQAAGEVLAKGDVIKRNVKPGDIPGIVDRTWAIAEIKHMSESRPQRIGLEAGGKLYTEHACDERRAACPKVWIDQIGGHVLTVFNIAADGRIQLLNSRRGQDAADAAGTWRAALNVAEPLGADAIVAVASRKRLPELDDWLREHDQEPAAGLLVAKLKQAIATDPALTIGTVGVFTAP